MGRCVLWAGKYGNNFLALLELPQILKSRRHYHQYHVAIMELSHFFYPFRSLNWSPLIPPALWYTVCLLCWVICYEELRLYFVSNFFCSSVFCPKLELHLTPLQFLHLLYNLSKCILLFIYILYLCCCYPSCVSCFNDPIFTSV
jgi:hypothetical protein